MLPPSIPTSFVPHNASSPASRNFHSNYGGAFAFICYGLLIVAFVLAILVFLYGQLLAANKSSREAELARAQAALDPATVESFVELRNRLTSGRTLLNNHLALSPFFGLLQRVAPTALRFTNLHLVVDGTGVVRLEAQGSARSFNALAAASTAFAADGRIRDAIFSTIVVSQANGSVSFALAATLDPKLVVFSPASAAASALPADLPPAPPATSGGQAPPSTGTTPPAPPPSTGSTPATGSGQTGSPQATP